MIGKRDLAKEIALEMDMDRRTINQLFSLLLNKMIEHLQKGQAINFNRFGKFLVIEEEISALNPETGKQESHPVRYVEFVPGSELNDKSMER
ncbi:MULTISPECIES: HU family DNA-binding protein [Enterococcus]|uniref:HU family DNA-binding protein n=1 Tax=Enterococcus TaxID=1350 RepID=UPI001788E70D|nr:HU family DNA-binding protein [Enterococcus avium]HAP3020848.1 HU family DNA-binding protein [Enterococcus faecalis]HBI1561762.1 HU family DNA-binding protein [Enterococcus faecalis]HBI1564810.1 HU family DNA-binding protein [Enterococcus faecalis]HBI1717973.1 HU family DNA-binding protein [Enterococcus faecalis]HBI1720826.1 HU family DNA-binding protein [Enterococcus faecalis]